MVLNAPKIWVSQDDPGGIENHGDIKTTNNENDRIVIEKWAFSSF